MQWLEGCFSSCEGRGGAAYHVQRMHVKEGHVLRRVESNLKDMAVTDVGSRHYLWDWRGMPKTEETRERTVSKFEIRLFGRDVTLNPGGEVWWSTAGWAWPARNHPLGHQQNLLDGCTIEAPRIMAKKLPIGREFPGDYFLRGIRRRVLGSGEAQLFCKLFQLTNV